MNGTGTESPKTIPTWNNAALVSQTSDTLGEHHGRFEAILPASYGRLVSYEIKDDMERMTCVYPLSSEESVSMHVRFSRSTEGSAIRPWLAFVDIVNTGPEWTEMIDLAQFYDTPHGGMMFLEIDPTLSGSPYYEAWTHTTTMTLPSSPLWLGSVLHEIGHAWQYQRIGNLLIEARKSMHAIRSLRESEREFTPAALDSLFNNKENILSSWISVITTLRHKKTISHEESLILIGVFGRTMWNLRHIRENWDERRDDFSDHRIKEVWMSIFIDSCMQAHKDGIIAINIFHRLENLIDMIFERDATAYAIWKLRQIDREIGTDLSHMIFQQESPDWNTFESTIYQDHSRALATYGAHRGEGGIAPGTPLPRLSDFDLPTSGA